MWFREQHHMFCIYQIRGPSRVCSSLFTPLSVRFFSGLKWFHTHVLPTTNAMLHSCASPAAALSHLSKMLQGGGGSRWGRQTQPGKQTKMARDKCKICLSLPLSLSLYVFVSCESSLHFWTCSKALQGLKRCLLYSVCLLVSLALSCSLFLFFILFLSLSLLSSLK